MKYYFITYQAKHRTNSHISIWNEVIDTSPMAFIKDVQRIEDAANGCYHNFIVINTCEISEAEFNQFKGEF